MLNPDGRLWIDRLADGLTETGERLSAADGERILRLVAHHVGAEVHPGAPRVSRRAVHGTWEDNAADVRRIDPKTGEVLESLQMPEGTFVTGLESDGADRFFCGGGPSGKVRAVRRPKRRKKSSGSN
jgi:hypothetical protein